MSLRVWLPLNGDLKNQGVDNSVFSIVSSNTTVNSSGKLGQCYANNSASAGGIISNTTVDLGTTQSMFCWFKFTSLTSGSSLGGAMVTQHRYSNNTGMGITIKYVSSTTGYLSVNTGTGSSRTYNTYCGTTLLQANTWYHGGFTYDGSNVLKIYVNGVCEYTGNIGQMSCPADYIAIFSWSFGLSGSELYSGFKLKGSINDVRVYDHCLSPKEVKEISKGLICHYPLDGNGKGNDNIVPNTFIEERSYIYPSSGNSDKWSAITSIIPSASQYVLSFYAKSTVNGDKARAHWYSPNTTTRCESSQGTVTTNSDGKMDITLSTEWKKYWIIYTQSETTAVKHLIFPRLVSGNGTGTVSVKQIKLEEGTIPTPWCPNSEDTAYTTLGYNNNVEYDTSGYKYNGTKTGTLTVSSDTAKYNCSTEFSKVGYIICSSFGVSTLQFTLNFWVKPKTATSQHFIFGTFDSWTNNGLGMYRNSGTTKYNCVLRSPEESSYKNQSLTPTIDVWSMLTIVYTGTTYIGYLNGVQEFSVTYGLNGAIINPVFMIGNSKYNDTPASENEEAFISDVRYYATALSADDIKELYQTSASVTNNGAVMCYEFNEE